MTRSQNLTLLWEKSGDDIAFTMSLIMMEFSKVTVGEFIDIKYQHNDKVELVIREIKKSWFCGLVNFSTQKNTHLVIFLNKLVIMYISLDICLYSFAPIHKSNE